MPNTYVALATQTLGTAAATVTFSSIPSGYTDLVLQCSLRADTSTFNNMNYPLLRFNGDSTSGLYSVTNLYARNTGGGDTAASSRSSSQNEINLGGVATSAMATGIFSTYQVQLQNYANTSVNKTVLARIGTGGNLTAMDGTWASVGLWRNTNAITSLSLTATSSGSFQIGSTFSLYGIKSETGDSTPKATGGTVTSDATYWYHTFTTSGNFVPNQTITADLLCVAGGGGAGRDASGGGGAGGYQTFTSQSLTAGNYAVLIGAGGLGAIGSGDNSNGTNSQFGSLTASVGGGRSSNYPTSHNASTGGSGGGGGWGGYPNGASGTAGQGNSGGNGDNGSGGGAGGGGAGGAAANAVGNVGTAGGVGLFTAISGGATTGAGQLSGGNYYFAGGGGGAGNASGGAGGLGGGGTARAAGGTFTTASNGLSNTGGGGANGWSQGGNGGSGIVIVRYTK